MRKSYAITFIFIMSFLILGGEDSYAQYRSHYASYLKRFSLSGTVRLTYRREWYSTGDKLSEFTHNYTLTHRGFVIDPRLISYDVEGSFSQNINDPGDNINFYGISTAIRFLSQRPRRGWLRLVPQPIFLRYSYNKSDFFSQTQYGLSFSYKRDEKIRFFYKGKVISIQKKRLFFFGNGENRNDKRGFTLPFPTFYFDFNKLIFKTEENKSDNNHISLRAVTSNKSSHFMMSFNYNKYKTDIESTSDSHFEFDSDFDLLRKRDKSLTMANRLDYNKFEDRKLFSIVNVTSYTHKFGKKLRDYVKLQIAPRYLNRDPDGDNYGVIWTGSYYKEFSPSLNNTLSASVDYEKDEQRDYHIETIANVIRYRISKKVHLSHTVSVGHDVTSNSYGTSIGIGLNIRYPMYFDYSYDHRAPYAGKRDIHRFTYTINGNFLRRFRFTSRNDYTIVKQKGDEPYEEKTLNLNLDVVTKLGRYNVGFGGTHYRIENTTIERRIKNNVTSLRLNLNTRPFRRANLYVSIIYSFNNHNDRTLSFAPTLTWYIRRVTFSAEYSYDKIMSDNSDRVHQRIYIRLTRSFYRSFRAPW